MKCPNCSYETEQPITFCPKCGVQVAPAPQTDFVPPINYAANRALLIVKDKLFLAMCILISAATLVSMGVMNILFTIFFWIIFAKGYKSTVSHKHFRWVSGVTYANYVIFYVSSITILVCSLLYIGLYGLAVSSDSTLIETPLTYYIPQISSIFPAEISQILDYFAFGSFLLIFGIIFTVFGVAMLLINIFANRKIHRLAKSFYQGIETGSLEVYKPRAVKNWLIVFAVFSGISTVSSLSQGLSQVIYSGAITAVEIIAVILINKYLLSAQTN